MAGTFSTKRVLITSFTVDLIDFITNVLVAIFTGSAVMLVEAMQGLADLTSVFLLMLGFKRSRKPATKKHPYGFGKEQYFWAVISAFLILAITASLSFYFGYQEFKNPTPVEYLWLAYLMLIFGMGTNGYAFFISTSKLLGGKPLKQLLRIFLESPHIGPKTTAVLDFTGFCAAFFGFAALVLYAITGDGRWDGIGAMGMAAILTVLAIILLIGVRSLVVGQSAPAELEVKIRKATKSVVQVQSVLGLQTMLLGSDGILVNIEVHLKNGLTTDQVEDVVDQVQTKIQSLGPGIIVHVEIEKP